MKSCKVNSESQNNIHNNVKYCGVLWILFMKKHIQQTFIGNKF